MLFLLLYSKVDDTETERVVWEEEQKASVSWWSYSLGAELQVSTGAYTFYGATEIVTVDAL